MNLISSSLLLPHSHHQVSLADAAAFSVRPTGMQTSTAVRSTTRSTAPRRFERTIRKLWAKKSRRSNPVHEPSVSVSASWARTSSANVIGEHHIGAYHRHRHCRLHQHALSARFIGMYRRFASSTCIVRFMYRRPASSANIIDEQHR